MRGSICLLALLALPGSAQRVELGGGGGYGFYRTVSVIAPGGTVDAGIQNRFTITAWGTDHMYEYLSGQIRYVYQDGDPFLKGSGQKVNVQGKSHSIHYDVLVYTRRRAARIRPHFAVGVGAKWYVVTGPANPDQPFLPIAQVTTATESKFLFDAGGGMEVRLKPRAVLLLDFRDYITTFPKKIIQPVPLATARGLFNQFTPSVSLAISF